MRRKRKRIRFMTGKEVRLHQLRGGLYRARVIGTARLGRRKVLMLTDLREYHQNV